MLIEPVEEMESLLVLDTVNNTIIFTGGEESFDLIGTELELKISLVNLWGQTTVYQQIIRTIGCPIVADDALALQTSIAEPTVDLIFDAGKVGVQKVSYTDKIDQIVQALKFDDFKEEYCGELVYELVSPYEFLDFDSESSSISLKSDKSSVEGYYTEAVVNVTVSVYNWQIPINATFEGCYVQSLSYGKTKQSFTYSIGSGVQE